MNVRTGSSHLVYELKTQVQKTVLTDVFTCTCNPRENKVENSRPLTSLTNKSSFPRHINLHPWKVLHVFLMGGGMKEKQMWCEQLSL